MAGISPKLPLSLDQDGYRLTKTITEAIAQDFKNLVLTSPGERVMDPEFGVGVRNFLFEQASESLNSSLRERIESQTAKYLPFVGIIDVILGNPTNDPSEAGHVLSVVIKYRIITTDDIDILTISEAGAI